MNEQTVDTFGNEMMTLNMGPQHPSTHGVIRFVVTSDGEIMQKAVPHVGYLHRGIEKIAEGIPWQSFTPYTDRVDYLAAMFANHGWAMAVERLAGIEVPPRAEYIRVIASELNRIASHLVAVGAMAMDIGAFTPFLHGIREREKINDLMEELCGQRLTYNFVRVGGVSSDLTPGWDKKALAFIEALGPLLDEFNRLITGNEILVKRCADVAVIDPRTAKSFGLVGPNLRASGVDWDLRRDQPYSVYDKFEFRVCTGKGWRGRVGDSYDRFVVRVDEMIESVKILKQALGGIPEGPVMAKLSKKLKPPKGEVYAAVESARGELGYYVVSDGGEQPYRAKIRTGSFAALSAIEALSCGLMIADLVVLIASFDVVAPEIDR
ncbi:MAG: NADH-quinone oxidoreductase subunit D [Deltaproteobacteria bacterium]|nr:NADH-quinone oxidoreductase subunit D [Deltaproteobacteria bacterium]